MFQYLMLLDTEEKKTLFEEIYDKHKDGMYRIAYDVLNNSHDAEDIVHESFLALISNIEKIMGNTPERTWNYIVTIVKNKAINLYRKKQRHGDQELSDMVLETEEPKPGSETEEQMIHLEQQSFLMDYINSLPESYREVLMLKYYHDMKGPEIAKLLGKSVDNVRHILMRARKRLLEMMEENGYSPEDW